MSEDFGGFKFDSLGTDKPRAPKLSELASLLRSTGNADLRFRMSAEGEIEFEGFTPDEIKDLLTTYREHLRLMGVMALEVQSSADAARWPINPDSRG